jgi:hypothetical protein
MTHYLNWVGETYALRVVQMSSFVNSEPTALLNKVAGRGAEFREDQEAPNSSQTAVAGLNEALSQLFDDVIESGETDQLRGYANEARLQANSFDSRSRRERRLRIVYLRSKSNASNPVPGSERTPTSKSGMRH